MTPLDFAQLPLQPQKALCNFSLHSLETRKHASECKSGIEIFHIKRFAISWCSGNIETETEIHFCLSLYDPADTAHHAAARAALLNTFSGKLDISRLAGLFPPSFSEPVFACAPQAAAQHKGSYCQDLIQGLHSFSNMVG